MDGIVIIAIGHELYAKYAYNNALSCYASNENIPITIITEESCIDKIGAERMTDLKSIGINFVYVNTDDCIIGGVKNYQLFKLKLYDLSPYERTLYLDADTIINNIKDVSELFGKCINKDFQTLCNAVWHSGDKKLHGRKYTHWGDINKIYAYHKLDFPFLYQTQSSLIYFTKSKLSKNIFETSHAVYLDKKIPCSAWAGGFPDEYCFNVAVNKANHQMLFPFTPIHGVNTNGELPAYITLRDRFYGMQTAGIKFSNMQHKIYDTTSNIAFDNLKRVKHKLRSNAMPFPLIEMEKKIIPVRKNY